jgi:hypothetical protein
MYKYSIIDRLENDQKKQNDDKDSRLLPKDLLDDQNSAISALTWGHNDQRVFVACSNILHVLRVHKFIPSLTV